MSFFVALYFTIFRINVIESINLSGTCTSLYSWYIIKEKRKMRYANGSSRLFNVSKSFEGLYEKG